jgi:hypothetical protein
MIASLNTHQNQDPHSWVKFHGIAANRAMFMRVVE